VTQNGKSKLPQITAVATVGRVPLSMGWGGGGNYTRVASTTLIFRRPVIGGGRGYPKTRGSVNSCKGGVSSLQSDNEEKGLRKMRGRAGTPLPALLGRREGSQ